MQWHDLSPDPSEPAGVLELTPPPDCPGLELHLYVLGAETYASWLLENGAVLALWKPAEA